MHFIDEETEIQTSSVTCPGLSGAKQNPNPGLSGLGAYSLKHDWTLSKRLGLVIY